MTELHNLGGLLPLRLKDTNGISLQCHNGSEVQSITLTDGMVYHVEWLTGESINFKCTQMFLPLDASTIKSTYTVEEFRYLVSRVVSVPATLLIIVFQPLQPRNAGHMMIETKTDTMIDTMTCSSGFSSDSEKTLCSITSTCVEAKNLIRIQVHVAVAVTDEYLLYAHPRQSLCGRCCGCFCKLSLGRRRIVGQSRHRKILIAFCDMCYATGRYRHLDYDDSTQLRKDIEVSGKSVRWIKTIVMAHDVLPIEEVFLCQYVKLQRRM